MDERIQSSVIDLANALGDETRLRILTILLQTDASALAVNDLAERLGLAQPRISTHLALLQEADLVTMRAIGRARIYRANTERALPAINGLLASVGCEPLRPASASAARAVRNNTPFRQARTCYDHLAGPPAVELLDGLIFDRWLVRAGGPDQRPRFDITEFGRQSLALIGVVLPDEETSRRVLACGCLDWTERKPHLGGALGKAVLCSLVDYGYVRLGPEKRQATMLRDLDGWLSERSPLRD